MGTVGKIMMAWLFIALAPAGASAGEVYGTVTRDRRPAGDATLELRRAVSPGSVIEVRTDEKGGYRVFLEPGQYEARLRAQPSAPLSAPQVVRSLPAPVRRDLDFRP